MTKQELIKAVAEGKNIQKKVAEDAVNGVFEAIADALAKGEKVQLIGFGTFEARERAAGTARNPRNPEEIISIAASKLPAFKAGKALKEAVNK